MIAVVAADSAYPAYPAPAYPKGYDYVSSSNNLFLLYNLLLYNLIYIIGF